MKRTHLFTVALMGSLAITVSGLAQTGGQGGQWGGGQGGQWSGEFDMEAIKERMAERLMNQHDSDSDGELTMDEYTSMWSDLQRWFPEDEEDEAADGESEGEATTAESAESESEDGDAEEMSEEEMLEQRQEEMFAETDADDDGVLTLEELVASFPEIDFQAMGERRRNQDGNQGSRNASPSGRP